MTVTPSTAYAPYVVDPGLVNTNIGNKKTGTIVNLFWSLRKRHGDPPAVPARTYAFLCEQERVPEGLYYFHCKKAAYGRQVTAENANRLFALSERLCGIPLQQGGNRMNVFITGAAGGLGRALATECGRRGYQACS